VDPAGKKEKPAGFVVEYLWILMSWKHEQKIGFLVKRKPYSKHCSLNRDCRLEKEYKKLSERRRTGKF